MANDDLFPSVVGDVDDFFVGVSKLLLSSSKYFRIAFSVNSIFFKIFRSTDFSFISSIIGGFPADIVTDVVTSVGIVGSISLLSCSVLATLSSNGTIVFADCSAGSDGGVLLGASLLDVFGGIFDDDDEADGNGCSGVLSFRFFGGDSSEIRNLFVIFFSNLSRSIEPSQLHLKSDFFSLCHLVFCR